MVEIYVISVAAIVWMLLAAAVHRTWLAGTCATGVLLLGALLVEVKNFVFSASQRFDVFHIAIAISLIVLLELFRIEWPVRHRIPEGDGGFPYLPASRGRFRRELLLFLGAFLPAVFFSGRFCHAAFPTTGEVTGFTAMHYIELTFATLAWVLATTFFIRFVVVLHKT